MDWAGTQNMLRERFASALDNMRERNPAAMHRATAARTLRE